MLCAVARAAAPFSFRMTAVIIVILEPSHPYSSQVYIFAMQLYPRSLAFGRAPLRTCFGRHLSLGSISALNTGALPQSLPDFTVLRTNVPTIFTCAPIEPVVELDHITTRSNVLFKQAARYIPPKELGYELPLDGLPEFAFVGRSNVGKSTLVGTLLGRYHGEISQRQRFLGDAVRVPNCAGRAA